MKNFVFLLMMAGTAQAQTIYVSSGQCINIGNQKVCATEAPVVVSSSYYPSQGIVVLGSKDEEVKTHAFCRLTDGKSPNVWQLCSTKRHGSFCLKNFSHFEGNLCQDEADKMNQK